MEVRRAEKIMFPSGSLHLEGLLIRGKIPKAVVISHPHPLYGGDMDNYVVGLISQAFEEKGWTTLRFNFRGVGRSQGDFDQGIGEEEDVLAAVDYLKGLMEGPIVLAGYSFGAWVNAQAAINNSDVLYSILVSPPLSMMEFAFLKEDAKTRLIVVGDQDPYLFSPGAGPIGPRHEIPSFIENHQKRRSFLFIGRSGSDNGDPGKHDLRGLGLPFSPSEGKKENL